MKLAIATAALLAFCMTLMGCERHFFKTHGTISSDGGQIGRWDSAPEGCARDPLDHQPIGQSTTVATFIWQDLRIRERDRRSFPDAPTRLELSRTDKGLSANLETDRAASGTTLDAGDCTTFDLTTSESQPAIAGGKPTLGGTLRMDCIARGSHIEADLRFSGCDF